MKLILVPADATVSFGDYVLIEQKRYGVPNEMYVHKVIGTLRSNSWVDVPVQTPARETTHDECVDVVACICCGVQETEVRRYRLSEVTIRARPPVDWDALAAEVFTLVLTRHMTMAEALKEALS